MEKDWNNYEYAVELLFIILSFLHNPSKTKELLQEKYLSVDEWIPQVRLVLGSNEEGNVCCLGYNFSFSLCFSNLKTV